jgi:hypothetical protein
MELVKCILSKESFMKPRLFGDFDPRFSFILIAFVVVLNVTIWPNAKVAGQRANTIASKQGIQTAQLNGKIVTQNLRRPDQPIEIIELTTNGKVTKLNKEVDASEEWLKGLSLKIRNTSDKPIVSFYLTFILPDTESSGNPPLALPIHYGASPPGAPRSGIGEPLEPNSTIDISITDQMYAILKPKIESIMPLRNLNHLQVGLDLIIFDDDTAWSAGELMRRDPNNPRRWVPIQ